MSTVAALLEQRQRLQTVSDSPALDIELLLCHCIERDRSYLRAWPEAQVLPSQEQRFLELLERRVAGEPIAYLIGRWGFWNLQLYVDASTLIPRPDTELLVETALEKMDACGAGSVLDLGTGTGAVALALAGERPRWRVLASDVSDAAVDLARRNRDHLGLGHVEIVQSDWYQSLGSERLQLIVSNPPYIDPGDPHLEEGDVRFEPRSALVSAREGFADIEAIIAGATRHLQPGGWLVFEHGYNQAQGVRQRLAAAGFAEVFTRRDLAGRERVSGGCYPGELSA